MSRRSAIARYTASRSAGGKACGERAGSACGSDMVGRGGNDRDPAFYATPAAAPARGKRGERRDQHGTAAFAAATGEAAGFAFRADIGKNHRFSVPMEPPMSD